MAQPLSWRQGRGPGAAGAQYHGPQTLLLPPRLPLAPWTPSAPHPAVPSPPSWDPMPSRSRCPSAKRYATAWTPPTHGAMTGGCWRRSSPWTGECPGQSPPGLVLQVWQGRDGIPVSTTGGRSGAWFGCTKSEGCSLVACQAQSTSLRARQAACGRHALQPLPSRHGLRNAPSCGVT